MAWLFLILAIGAVAFVLPGGGRSPADRRLAQGVAVAALAGALFSWGLGPLGVIVLLAGLGLGGSVFCANGWALIISKTSMMRARIRVRQCPEPL